MIVQGLLIMNRVCQYLTPFTRGLTNLLSGYLYIQQTCYLSCYRTNFPFVSVVWQLIQLAILYLVLGVLIVIWTCLGWLSLTCIIYDKSDLDYVHYNAPFLDQIKSVFVSYIQIDSNLEKSGPEPHADSNPAVDRK